MLRLLSSHGAAALRAVGSITQNPHPHKITAGGTFKPVAVPSDGGQEKCLFAVFIAVSSHGFFLHSVSCNEYVPASFAGIFPVLSVNGANGMGGKAALGAGFLFHKLIPQLAEQLGENITHDSAPVGTT